MLNISRKISFVFLISSIAGCSVHESSQVDPEQNSVPFLEVPFENNLIIPVIINNRQYSFLVDTGASLTIVDKNIAAEITRSIHQSELPTFYREMLSRIHTTRGVSEREHYVPVKPLSFIIGSEEFRDDEIWLAADMTIFTQLLGVKIDGLIGVETFRKINWLINNDKKILQLLKNAPPVDNWQNCTGYSDSFTLSPLLSFNYGNDSVNFNIDTGADVAYASNEFINMLKLKKGAITAYSKKNTMSGDLIGNYESSDFILNGLTFNNMPLGELRITDNSINLYAMGLQFLSRFNRYAFIPSRMLFCYDAKSIEKQGLTPKRNLSIRYVDQGIEFFYNDSDSIAGTGIKNGDIILKINNKSYSPVQIDNIREILNMTPSGNLSITIQRHGMIKTINL